MSSRLLTTIAAAALAIPAGAQMQRRAVMVGGGTVDSGRCVANVLVDGSAEIRIAGDTATLVDISGRQPEWQGFECSGPMPANANIRMNAEGRGRVSLISSPVNGGPAILRIDDPAGGPDVYRVEMSWTNAYGSALGAYGGLGTYGSDLAVANCRQSVRQEAISRFGTPNVRVGRIDINDNAGRLDEITGIVNVRRGFVNEQYPFSCSVNLDNGRVRTAMIEAPGTGYAARDIQAREMDTCRTAVTDRLGGYRVQFGNMTFGSRYGNDIVNGTAWTGLRSYGFSCTVNPYNGNVRDVDIFRR